MKQTATMRLGAWVMALGRTSLLTVRVGRVRLRLMWMRNATRYMMTYRIALRMHAVRSATNRERASSETGGSSGVRRASRRRAIATWRGRPSAGTSPAMWASSRVSFFFFQAEDGIRDLIVTGVQTCALPISQRYSLDVSLPVPSAPYVSALNQSRLSVTWPELGGFNVDHYEIYMDSNATAVIVTRSEERRVGKECRYRWSPYH